MVYMPKSAVEVTEQTPPSSPGYMPKSAVLAEPQQDEKKPKRSLLKQVAGMLGMGTTADNVGIIASVPGLNKSNKEQEEFLKGQSMRTNMLLDRLANETDPEKKAFLKKAIEEQSKGTQRVVDNFQGIQKEVADEGRVSENDQLNGGLDFATKRAAGSSAEVASLLLPGTKEVQGVRQAAKGTGAAQRILTEAGVGGVQGALQGGAEASIADDNIYDAVGKILKGGGTGAAISGGIQGLAEVKNAAAGGINKVTGAAKQKLKDVYRSTLKQNIADQKFYKQAGGIDKVVEDAVRLELPNTKDGVRKELMRYGDEFTDLVDQELAKKEGTTSVNIKNIYEKAKQKTLANLDTPETQGMLKQAQAYFDAADKVYLGPGSESAGLKDVNELRKRLDGIVGELLQQDITNGQAKAIKSFASGLREEFRQQVPELKDAFRKYELLSGLAEAMQKEPQFGLTNLVGGAVLAPGGLPAAAIGGVGATAVRSPGLKRSLASSLMKRLSSNPQASTNTVAPSVLQSVAAILGSRQQAAER